MRQLNLDLASANNSSEHGENRVQPPNNSSEHGEKGTRRVLTLKQPWAWAIVCGGKTIENRVWPTSYRGRLYIHAGKSYERNGEQYIESLGISVPDNLPRGGIVGHCELIACGSFPENPWAMEDQFHWLLRNAEASEFEPMKGKLGIWRA